MQREKERFLVGEEREAKAIGVVDVEGTPRHHQHVLSLEQRHREFGIIECAQPLGAHADESIEGTLRFFGRPTR